MNRRTPSGRNTMYTVHVRINVCINILLLRSNPRRQHSRRSRGGGRRTGNPKSHGEVEMKRKWWVLVQPPYSSQGKGRQLPG